MKFHYEKVGKDIKYATLDLVAESLKERKTLKDLFEFLHLGHCLHAGGATYNTKHTIEVLHLSTFGVCVKKRIRTKKIMGI